VYSACELAQTDCIPEREKASHEDPKAKESGEIKYSIAVADKPDTKKRGDNRANGSAPSKCSWPCYVVNKMAEDMVAFFTAILCYVVYIQVLLAFSQEKWLRRAYKVGAYANTLARDANKVAQDTSVSMHRPTIRVKHVFLMSDIWNDDKIKIELAIVNTGINTAHIIECNIATLVLPEGKELPQIPKFDSLPFGLSHPYLPGGKTYVLPNHWEGKKFSDEENFSIGFGKSNLYCFGYVDYIDLTGTVVRKTAFVRVLDVHDRKEDREVRFVKLDRPNTDYEYAD
jgi:hypothetical protein